MLRNIYVIGMLLLSVVACSPTNQGTSKQNSLSAAQLQPYGRTILNANQELELISSAVHFGFSFSGESCKLFAAHEYEGGHNYLQYVVDGVYKRRVRVEGKGSEPIVITGAGTGRHTVWIYKATEAHTGPVLVKKITGDRLQVLQKPRLPLIEFIGNSITCGAAADPSEIPCGTAEYHDQHNAYYAYGPRLARALGTGFILSSVSGIGIYRNWNSDGPIMPDVYEKTDFRPNSVHNWDFKRYDPKIVSIALGTNDFSNGDGKKKRMPFDSAKFVNNYIQFVRLIKTKYPKAAIVLLSSPMVNGSRRELLQNCLSAVKQNVDPLYPSQKAVELFFFKPMTARGCGGHPSVEDHAVMAEEMEEFFRGVMGKL